MLATRYRNVIIAGLLAAAEVIGGSPAVLAMLQTMGEFALSAESTTGWPVGRMSPGRLW